MSRTLSFEAVEDRRLLTANCVQFPDHQSFYVETGDTVEVSPAENGYKITQLGLIANADLEVAKNGKSVTVTPDDGYEGLLYFQFLAGRGQCSALHNVSIQVGSPSDVTIELRDDYAFRDEGDAGTWFVSFSVYRSSALGTASVSYTLEDITAEGGVDYVATNGVIDWEPGEYFTYVNVPVIGDVDFESDETFSVTLHSPVDAVILEGYGVGTILNDDA